MYGKGGTLHFRCHQEPVVISLEELGTDSLAIVNPKITAPGILADGKSLFVVRQCRLIRKGDGIIHCGLEEGRNSETDQ